MCLLKLPVEEEEVFSFQVIFWQKNKIEYNKKNKKNN